MPPKEETHRCWDGRRVGVADDVEKVPILYLDKADQLAWVAVFDVKFAFFNPVKGSLLFSITENSGESQRPNFHVTVKFELIHGELVDIKSSRTPKDLG
ncbi:hypothetical protein A1Q2_08492 [Trichosporon asahii var. asahii CBS 8904]|uniref:Uncharacterized protein n=1 Tax=Trichosporon asahii var. asahii (strain CBS 8904) TaxID=1220162 RepID=K1V953_TRIAC|nr:hypothetical protein A1Q2_08492 [Trichosporon asahii var. asahii CBS 8904]